MGDRVYCALVFGELRGRGTSNAKALYGMQSVLTAQQTWLLAAPGKNRIFSQLRKNRNHLLGQELMLSLVVSWTRLLVQILSGISSEHACNETTKPPSHHSIRILNSDCSVAGRPIQRRLCRSYGHLNPRHPSHFLPRWSTQRALAIYYTRYSCGGGLHHKRYR